MVNWPTKKMEDVVDFIGGLWVGKKEPLKMVKVLRNTNFRNSGCLDYSNVAEIKVEERQLDTRLLKIGDIILEKSGGGPEQPVGRVVYFDKNGEYSFSNFTCCLRIKDNKEVFSKYLWFFLYSQYLSGITEKMQKQTTGIRNLMMPEYKKIEIPLPIIAEQRRIVKKIEELFAKIDETQKLREESKKSASVLLQSALNEIFSGQKSKNWERIKLGNLIKVLTPPKKIQKSNFSESGKFPIIDQSQNEISGWSDDKTALVQITQPVVIFGDHTCAVKFCEKPFIQGADGIKILSANKKILPRFLYLLLKIDPLKSISYRRHFSKLREKEIFLPSLAEQKKIVAYLDSLSEKIHKLQELQQKTADDFKNLKKSILVKAFKGHIKINK